MKFRDYIDESDTVSMIELAYFLDEYTINEDIIPDIKDVGKGLSKVLSTIGLKAKKEKGLIEILSKAGKDIGFMFYYLFKYQTSKDEVWKTKILDTVKKIKKEDVIDVLLKLDILTLHLFTGPIHALNALTGWHISVNTIKDTADDINDRAKKVILHITALIDKTVGETQKKLIRFLKQLKNNFKFSSQISTEVLD